MPPTPAQIMVKERVKFVEKNLFSKIFILLYTLLFNYVFITWILFFLTSFFVFLFFLFFFFCCGGGVYTNWVKIDKNDIPVYSDPLFQFFECSNLPRLLKSHSHFPKTFFFALMIAHQKWWKMLFISS